MRVCDAHGTRTDLFSPSGKLFTTIPAGSPQPLFVKQRIIVLENKTYALYWSLTPKTPNHT
ncbi:hypothetical protein [Spirosoma fluviale]|uniref:hypothetical protein n=1 Tax=Spirosoma fluviale TaxID=1597977 RepID=UPI000BE2ACEF|nr:hypothetical protein [Spirosoma fluviale]